MAVEKVVKSTSFSKTPAYYKVERNLRHNRIQKTPSMVWGSQALSPTKQSVIAAFVLIFL